jgi:hypothetical protein
MDIFAQVDFEAALSHSTCMFVAGGPSSAETGVYALISVTHDDCIDDSISQWQTFSLFCHVFHRYCNNLLFELS